MTWILNQLDKVNFLDKELEHINNILLNSHKQISCNKNEYALILKEKELLIKYKQCINEQIKLYCNEHKDCNVCHDTTVHLVLGD